MEVIIEVEEEYLDRLDLIINMMYFKHWEI